MRALVPLAVRLLVGAIALPLVFAPADALAQKKKRASKGSDEKPARKGKKPKTRKERPRSRKSETPTSTPKDADVERPRVVVTAFEGPKSKEVRGYVEKVVKEGDVELVEGSGDDELRDDAAYVAAARELDASAFVTGKVKLGKVWSLEVVIREGKTGDAIETLSFKGGNLGRLKADIEKSFWMQAADPVYRARAPERDEGDGDEQGEKPGADDESTEEKKEDDEPAEDEPAGPRPSPLDLLLALRGYSRTLTFHDDLFEVMRRHNLGAAPAGALNLSWYPLAHFQGGPLAHLGIMAGYEHGFATTTLDNAGAELDTSMTAFFVGPRGRLPIGKQELAMSFTFGQHSFSIDGDERRPFPDVEHTYLRPALDATFRVDSVSFGFHAGHRFRLSTGELESASWFPRLTGAGFDAGLFIGQALYKTLEIRGGVDMRRYYFAMNPELGDRYIVGGAVDQYLSIWAGFAYRIPPSE